VKTEDGITLRKRIKSGCQLLIQEETGHPVVFCRAIPTHLTVVVPGKADVQGFVLWLLAACRTLLHKSDVWMESSSDFLSYL